MKLPFLLLTFAFLAWSSPICTDLDEAFKTVVEANEEVSTTQLFSFRFLLYNYFFKLSSYCIILNIF